MVFIYFYSLTGKIELSLILLSCALLWQIVDFPHVSVSVFIFFLTICKNSLNLLNMPQRFFPHCHFYCTFLKWIFHAVKFNLFLFLWCLPFVLYLERFSSPPPKNHIITGSSSNSFTAFLKM